MPLQHSMSKKDLILAQKTFAANKLKWELKNSKDKTVKTKSYTPLDSHRPGRSNDAGFDSMQMSHSASSPELQSPKMTNMLYSPMKPQVQPNSLGSDTSNFPPGQSGMKRIDVKELGTRGLTSATGLRKTNLTVSQKVLEKKGRDSRLQTDPEALLEELSRENYYLPKVTITRPDGATLMDIYRSKQADTWSRILKAQIREEEDGKVSAKKQHEDKNAEFGKKVRADLASIAVRKGAMDNSDDKLALIQEESSKRADDVQKKRREDATTRQKLFIGYALQDIEVKAAKRRAELEREIEASTMSINRVKAEIALDEKRKADKKALEADRLEKLFRENQVNLKRKEALRLKQFEEDRRVFLEAEVAAQREDERRAADLAKKTKQATDGPAHRVAQAVLDEHLGKEKIMFETLLNAGNLLNKQLMGSEECKRTRILPFVAHLEPHATYLYPNLTYLYLLIVTAARQRNAGKGLTTEWDKNMAEKARAAAAEEEHTRKVMEYNAKKLKEMAAQDEEAREKKKQAALTYQRELDRQLSIVRTRQIQALTRTMSEEEEKYNTALLKKYNVV